MPGMPGWNVCVAVRAVGVCNMSSGHVFAGQRLDVLGLSHRVVFRAQCFAVQFVCGGEFCRCRAKHPLRAVHRRHVCVGAGAIGMRGLCRRDISASKRQHGVRGLRSRNVYVAARACGVYIV